MSATALRQGLIAFLLFTLLTGQLKADRVALVIGNGAYLHTSKLTNPINDAMLIAATLRDLDFDVREAMDLAQFDFLRTLQAFKADAAQAEIAVIYFAGHGIELDRRNFLVPIDATLRQDTDVFFEAIALDLLLGAVEPASKLRLVILDACRNNPFQASMTRSAGTRSLGRGLAAVEPTSNTLVAFAAKEGTVAFDGTTGNSPYARALHLALKTPEVEIAQVFRLVRDDVLVETRGAQEPFVYGSLSAEEIFLAAAPRASISERAGGADPVELAVWEYASRSTREEDVEEYLNRYPDGAFSGFARRKLADIRAAAPADAGVPEPRKSESNGDQTNPNAGVQQIDKTPASTVILNREEVREVQEILTILNLRPGPIDGLQGERTINAIRRFQEHDESLVTGELTLEQLERLRAVVTVSQRDALRASIRAEERRRTAARAAAARSQAAQVQIGPSNERRPTKPAVPDGDGGSGDGGGGSGGSGDGSGGGTSWD